MNDESIWRNLWIIEKVGFSMHYSPYTWIKLIIKKNKGMFFWADLFTNKHLHIHNLFMQCACKSLTFLSTPTSPTLTHTAQKNFLVKSQKLKIYKNLFYNLVRKTNFFDEWFFFAGICMWFSIWIYLFECLFLCECTWCLCRSGFVCVARVCGMCECVVVCVFMCL